MTEQDLKEFNTKKQALLTAMRIQKGDSLAVIYEEIGSLLELFKKIPKGEQGEQGEQGPQGEQGYRGIAGIDGRDGTNGRDGRDGEDGIDGETPLKGVDYFTSDEQEQIVNQVFKMIKQPKDGKDADVKWLINALKNDKDFLEKVKGDKGEAGNTVVRQFSVMGGRSSNLEVLDETISLGQAVRKMIFSGSGVQAVRNADGVVTINITGTASTETDEVATNSGDNTIFTITNTPNAGTLMVYNSDTGQIFAPSLYSNTGTNITFNTAFPSDLVPVIRAKYAF